MKIWILCLCGIATVFAVAQDEQTFQIAEIARDDYGNMRWISASALSEDAQRQTILKNGEALPESWNMYFDGNHQVWEKLKREGLNKAQDGCPLLIVIHHASFVELIDVTKITELFHISNNMILGTIIKTTPGFIDRSPCTLVTLRIDQPIKGKYQKGDIVSIFYYNTKFSLNGMPYCVRDYNHKYLSPQKDQKLMVFHIRESVNLGPGFIYADSKGMFFEDSSSETLYIPEAFENDAPIRDAKSLSEIALKISNAQEIKTLVETEEKNQ